MDYGDVDTKKGAEPDRLINDLELPVFELDESEVGEALKAVTGGREIQRLIDGEPWEDQPEGSGEDSSVDDGREFGRPLAELEQPPQSETWTLVVLSNLKPTGRDLKLGILRRMLCGSAANWNGDVHPREWRTADVDEVGRGVVGRVGHRT